jgi:hypothetical protein
MSLRASLPDRRAGPSGAKVRPGPTTKRLCRAVLDAIG